MHRQNELVQMLETPKTVREYCHETNDPEFKEKLKHVTYQKIYEIAKNGIANKKIRNERFDAVKEEFVATLAEEEKEEKKFLISTIFSCSRKRGYPQLNPG